MTRRQKSMKQCPIPCQHRRLSKRQRRRRRQREQYHLRLRTNSSVSVITQIAADTLIESSTKPFNFIERHELTRQQTLRQPLNQQPIVFLVDEIIDDDLRYKTNEDHSSSYV